MQEKDFSKIEVKNNIYINMFGYENELVFPICISDQKFKDSMDFLLLIDDDKSHYLYIKDFERSTFHKTKNTFAKVVYSILVVKMYWQNIKKKCLIINGKQSVKVEEGAIEFENYFKQIPVPFKVYAHFGCDLENFESYEGSDTKKYQNHVPCSFAYKVACIDDRFTKTIVGFRGKNAAYEFLKAILKECEYCKKVIKKHFNKNLILSEEEHLSQQSNSCWICKKLIDNDDEKVRDHCHITGKFRGVAHWSCNISLQLTKKVPAIFHNLRGYDSHAIFCELNKFDVKISVIPNGLEKDMVFSLGKNLVFIDSMRYMNSSLDRLVKNLSDEDFKYLLEEFGSKNLKLLKQKGAYPYEYMNSFERFKEKKLPAKKCFFSSTKNWKIDNDGKISGLT